ncbi:MAG: lysoplasmalogenase [Oscillospiraceae bacterium]|nr:lysoplasmalogenase [Oscillospiraceae bacterium]
MKHLFLILYIAVSVLHLVASWRDEPDMRKKTKPFLLILLLLYYLFAAKSPSVLLILALLTSWLGDVLLIPKGHKWFTMGGIAFMFSHLFFVLVYCGQITLSKLNPVVIALIAVLYYGFSLLIIRSIRGNTPKSMIAPMCFYLICNSTMNLFAMMQLLSRPSPGAAAAYVGALLFYVSDCCLFLVRYGKKPEIIFKKHFTVMLTYLLGELLIVVGMLMLQR